MPARQLATFLVDRVPSLDGVQQWIKAEMAPPYGLHGYYEYQLSSHVRPDVFSEWTTDQAPEIVPRDDDPHRIPELGVDAQSVVLIMFARYRPGTEALTPQQRGDLQHVDTMREIARRYGLKRLAGFELLSPQQDWHRAWIVELPTFEAAEAWVTGEETLPHGMYAQRAFHLARKWSPQYFASWVKRG